MKLLRIDNSAAEFLSKEGEYKFVDKLTKEDLLYLVDLALSDEDASFDEYTEDALKNQAHQVVYKSLLQRLSDLHRRRKDFSDASARLYLAEYERYRDG
jgi:hypothetical protein